MACECNYVMLSVCVILFLGVASQTLSFALPGWTQWEPSEDVFNGTEKLFEKGKTYTSGLWAECEGGLEGCDDWLDKSLEAAKSAGLCAADTIQSVAVEDKKPCRKYDNILLTMWVTQALGLVFLAIALVLAILASVAFCCGGCCGDCCVGFCKFFVLLVCMLGAMAITTGLVLFGVNFTEDDYNGFIIKQNHRVPLKSYTLFYSFALSALAAVMAVLAAIISAFSRNDDGKV